GENLYGRRQNMDITNPTYRRYAERIIRELVSRTAPLPNVIGFQIDNETKHYGVHSARVVSVFRDWLRKRFPSIKALNDAYGLYHWSNNVDSFEELPDPAGTINGSYACAFEEYRRELAAEFLLWQAGIVGEYTRPDQFVTHNFDVAWVTDGAGGQQDGYSGGVQPDINHYDAAKAVTLIGTDVYCPTADRLTGREIAFGGDSMRPLRRENYLVLESQSQAFCGWLPYPGQLRLMALSHLASGARGVMYWPWFSIHNGIESYWKGILNHDGEQDAVYEEISQIGGDLRRLSPALWGMKKKNRIALIVSPEALHALRWFPTDKDISYNDVVNAFHQALYRRNLECDILYDRETDWSPYSLLIFPELYCCTDALIQRVREFTAGGGSVFAGFRSFFADEHLKIRRDRQPHGLTDVFGMHYSRFTKDGRTWMDLLEPDTAEAVQRYDHPYWSRFASLTLNRFEKGHAWYLGTLPEEAELEEILCRAAEAAGISAPSNRWPIVQREGLSGAGKRLAFLLNYSCHQREAVCPFTGRDLLTGISWTAGDFLPVSDWGAAILEEESL
ncbi:MAG: beta-galactosidase, partial [Oscillibacter sp.]|nr:beta-galactosidase [Oscillibacter sp.]